MEPAARRIRPLGPPAISAGSRSGSLNRIRSQAEPHLLVRMVPSSPHSTDRPRGSARPAGRKRVRSSSPAAAGMLDVHLDSWLREFGPRGSEQLQAGTVAELLDALEGKYPRLRFKIRDETGSLRRYVRIFVDGEDVSGTTGVTTSLEGTHSIDILHSIAGG